MRKNNFLSWLMFFSFLLSTLNIQAQEIKVSGKVTDTKGEPVPGVEIVIVGTQKGTVTDFDGLYSIKANKGDKLRASSVGMKSVTKTVTGSTLDFVLQADALGLDEVVVTAQSGIVTKKQLGSVIHSVKAEDLPSRNVANISEALQGNLPGAQIMRNNGSAAPSISIRLRGPSTILGSSEPLIMIDGVIINNQERSGVGSGGSSDPLSDIDMNDIDRIEVVNGPAASAMYGSMASNGIIQIFTKKGKTGEPNVTVTSNLSISSVRKYKPFNTSLYKWGNVNGNIVPVPIEKRYDFQSYIFRKAYGEYTGVNVSGGNEYTSYMIAASILDNDGIIRNSNYNRKNINLKLNQKISKWLKTDMNVIYSKNKTVEIPYGSNSDYVLAPLQSILFADNSIKPKNEDGTYNSMGWQGNPYESVDQVDANLNIDRVITNFGIQATPIENLKIDYTFGYDYTASNSKLLVPYGFGADHDGRLDFTNNKYQNFNSHIRANYNYNITDIIKASTGVGYQYLYDKKMYNFQGKPTLPIFSNLEVMDGTNEIKATSSVFEYAIWGTWIQQNFNFDKKLFLTIGGRWDKASMFEQDGNNFYPKVSGSLVLSDFDFWQNIEKYLNSFKLRAAWGKAGNMSALTNPGYLYTYEGSLYMSNSYYDNNSGNNGVAFLLNYTDGNKDIKTEVTEELEFGFDAALLNGKLGVEFTMYHQNVYNLLLETAKAYSSGYSKKINNVGTLTNDGIEISLNSKLIDKKYFKWNMGINYSTNKNEVNNIDGGFVSLNVFGNDNSILANGYPLTTFYGTFYATDSNGNWVLDNNGNPQLAKGTMIDKDGDGFTESYEQLFDSNGQPTGDVLKKVLGKTNPDYTISLNNTFKYKNLSLNIVLDAAQGYNVLDWDKRMAYSLPLSSTSLFTGWEFAGEELENNNRGWYGKRFGIYESFIEDGSYVKLRNVSISYNWNKPFKYLKSIQFTLSGSNLISWDNYWGYDPEGNSWGKSNLVRSQDYANIPIPKTYTFGAKIKF